ncbi:MmyB family transcriptional regulator [Streptomyces mirabilis]
MRRGERSRRRQRCTPVFVVNYRQIISNRLSRTLITDVDALPNRRRNIGRFVLLDPGRPRPVENWAEVVRRQRHHGRGRGHCCHLQWVRDEHLAQARAAYPVADVH